MRSDSQPAEVRAKLFDEEDLGANTTRLGIVASLGARDLQALRLLDIHRIARFAVNKGIGVAMKVLRRNVRKRFPPILDSVSQPTPVGRERRRKQKRSGIEPPTISRLGSTQKWLRGN